MPIKYYYIVMASEGEYDTFSKWPVKVFTHKLSAEKFAKKQNSLHRAILFEVWTLNNNSDYRDSVIKKS